MSFDLLFIGRFGVGLKGGWRHIFDSCINAQRGSNLLRDMDAIWIDILGITFSRYVLNSMNNLNHFFDIYKVNIDSRYLTCIQNYMYIYYVAYRKTRYRKAVVQNSSLPK